MHSKIPVTRSSMPPLEEYVSEIAEIWENRWLTNNGEKYNQLERLLCGYLEVPYISMFTNGHMGLELALQVLGLEGEVITTPFTFASTTQAIVRSGLTPVFCDISAKDFTLDVNKIEDLITSRTTAILPVHVYGHICNIEAIERIAKKYDLKVIYDAAHAFGEKLDGIGVGNFGHLSMFSFHATKVFHTIEGGAVVCHDEKILKRLAALKNFGLYSSENIGEIGGNSKMNEFQAAMGLCNLRYIEQQIKRRKIITERYYEQLKDIDGVYFDFGRKDVKSNYAYLPVIIESKEFGINRDSLCQHLQNKNVFPRKYFYPLTSQFDCFKGRFEIQSTPVAEKIAQKILTLPLYADMTLEDVDYICAIIKDATKDLR